MPEPRTCPLPTITALFYIGVDRLGSHIVVFAMTELGGRL